VPEYLGQFFFKVDAKRKLAEYRRVNAAIITLKQTACRCPTVGAAAPTAIGGRRAGA